MGGGLRSGRWSREKARRTYKAALIQSKKWGQKDKRSSLSFFCHILMRLPWHERSERGGGGRFFRVDAGVDRRITILYDEPREEIERV